jgi:hypothetical protein
MITEGPIRGRFAGGLVRKRITETFSGEATRYKSESGERSMAVSQRSFHASLENNSRLLTDR